MARKSTTPRIVVVGCGRWGRNHVRNYAALGALAGIVDRHPDRVAEQAAAAGVPVLSFEEALADPGVDAMAFALPPSQNLPLGRLALEAGKHLFVEKPLALSAGEGEEMCDLADRHGRRLMVGHILQYHSAFRALLDLVRDGRLGRLQALASTRFDLGRIRREEDALWALAPHDVSMILALVGEEPVRVAASGGYHTHPAIADDAGLVLDFAAARADISVSWLRPVKEQRLVAVGSDAMAVFDDREPWERKLALRSYRIDPAEGAPIVSTGDAAYLPVEAAEPLQAECRHFLACIADGTRPLTDGREGLRVLRVLERAGAAMASRSRPAARRA